MLSSLLGLLISTEVLALEGTVSSEDPILKDRSFKYNMYNKYNMHLDCLFST